MDELPVWINRIGARTPIIYLTNRHLINAHNHLIKRAKQKHKEALALVSKDSGMCGEQAVFDFESFQQAMIEGTWEDHLLDVFYDIEAEIEARGLVI